MRITRLQLRSIIREALETTDDPSVTFRPGDVVEVRGSDSGLWQVVGIEGSRARLRMIGSMLDGDAETHAPLNRLMKSNSNA